MIIASENKEGDILPPDDVEEPKNNWSEEGLEE